VAPEEVTMASVTLERVAEQLRQLPPEKLILVAEFIHTLAREDDPAELRDLLLAAETSLRKDWDSPEEDVAWERL
jgi:hypothetical protein